MKFIQGQDRTQINLFPVSLDQSIDPENEVRIIDLFVDSLPIKDFGFRMDFIENGRPAYHPADLLKLFIYGYLNKVRSTRDLEKECRLALGGGLRALGAGLIIQNPEPGIMIHKKINCNHSKIDRYIAYGDNKLEDYTIALAENDGDNRPQYKRRQAIVEHPYGTIKRQWGFNYILTKKGIARAGSDIGLMFIAYNLRRIGNILTRDVLKEYLRVLLSLFLGIQGLTEAVLMNYEPIMEPEPVFLRKRSQYRISHLNRSVLRR
ncbi:MAG: transposase [Bacteroidales bacterium]|nr:transposase [Bacteroidales bacterium]